MLFVIGAMAFVFWLAWRGLLFVRLLLEPVGKALGSKKLDPVRKVVDSGAASINQHVDDTLRRSGMGAVVDFNKRIDSAVGKLSNGLDRAMEESQRRIDERNKPKT